MLHSKAMYSTFTNMECVEDDYSNGGEDDNNMGEEVDHETRDTDEHEDGPTNDDVDFHEHSDASSGMDVFVDFDISNVDIEVDCLARMHLIKDEIET